MMRARKSGSVGSDHAAGTRAGDPRPSEAAKPRRSRRYFRQSLPNIAGKTFTVVTVDFAPGMRAVPHRHGQAFVYAYVLQGSVRSQLEGTAGSRPSQLGRVGPSLSGAHHVSTENPNASEPARLLVVFDGRLRRFPQDRRPVTGFDRSWLSVTPWARRHWKSWSFWHEGGPRDALFQAELTPYARTEKLPTPVPGPGQVVAVSCRRCRVGPWDASIREGKRRHATSRYRHSG